MFLNQRVSSPLNQLGFRFLDVRQNLQQRVEQILRDQTGKLNATQLGKLVGLSKGRVSQIRRDGAVKAFTYAGARELNTRFGYSIAWLLDGQGPRFTDERVNEGEIVYVEWYHGTKLAAGSGIYIESDGDLRHVAFRHDWLRHQGLQLDKLAAVHADGPSMLPRIQHGDLLLINRSDTEIQNGKIYAFLQGNHVLDKVGRVKRLFRSANGDLRIISDNQSPEFSEEVVEASKLDQIEVIGRVVWIAGNV